MLCVNTSRRVHSKERFKVECVVTLGSDCTRQYPVGSFNVFHKPDKLSIQKQTCSVVTGASHSAGPIQYTVCVLGLSFHFTFHHWWPYSGPTQIHPGVCGRGWFLMASVWPSLLNCSPSEPAKNVMFLSFDSSVVYSVWCFNQYVVDRDNACTDWQPSIRCPHCRKLQLLGYPCALPICWIVLQLSYSCGNCGNSWPLSQGTAAVFQAVSIEWNHCHSDRPVDWTETCHVQWPQDLLQTSQLHVTILISNYYSNVSMPIQASSSGNEWEISVWL